MLVELDNISWSPSGKRVDFAVDVYTGGLFSKGSKEFSFKMFALGSEAALKKYVDSEDSLAELVATEREKWLQNEGNRYYNHSIKDEGINARIWKSKYQTYES